MLTPIESECNTRRASDRLIKVQIADDEFLIAVESSERVALRRIAQPPMSTIRAAQRERADPRAHVDALGSLLPPKLSVAAPPRQANSFAGVVSPQMLSRGVALSSVMSTAWR